MKTKKFSEFIEINESSKINDPQELLQKCETYLDNTDVLSKRWVNLFFEILQKDESYRSIAYGLEDPIQKIQTERNSIKQLMDNLQIFINRLDRKYKKEGDLPDDEDKLYDELDETSRKLENVLDQMKELRDEFKSMSKNYLNIEDNRDFIRRFNFK
tara:strand:- start:1877 stop:2347 length:471 start_codon:yes stop_codon:yes gene_type:complete